ncbi:hypothetical protein HA402_004999 [Bradysia odoriphaga]|nr:hypothetical protein HA402_004999 [Bradysia odoriphaga]
MGSKSTNGISFTKSKSFDDKLKHSLSVVNKAFDDYDFREIFLSFNGGKDCTVLLHMVYDVWLQRKEQAELQYAALLCIYLQPAEPFEEIESFVKDCSEKYFPIAVKLGIGTKQDALFAICDDYPELKAVFMGSRRTDPYCQQLKDFEMTTKGWPELMRINPLLDWTCDDIWTYLKSFNVPYCSLYDVGYTSLGDKTNTVPNPHLKYFNNDTGKTEYYPAYYLKDADAYERVGRLTSAPNGS